MDNLTTCPLCSGNACYEQVIQSMDNPEPIKTYLCFGCGLSSSTLMTEDSVYVKDTRETSPELYNDLSKIDKNGLVWFPATISIPAKGMVFADGVDNTNWSWKAAKAVRILKEEKEKYPEGQEYRMDMKGAKAFGQKDFMDALEYIDFYQV